MNFFDRITENKKGKNTKSAYINNVKMNQTFFGGSYGDDS